MRKISILLGILTLLVIFGSCSKDALDLDESKLDDKKSKLQNREFVAESLTPNYMENSEIRQMQIYTPPGYDKHGTKSYPVIYLLQGLPLGEKSYLWPKLYEPWIGDPMPFFAAPDFPEEGFREWMDGLIESGQVQPLIIVMPDADNNLYGWSLFTNSVLNGGFEDYIVNDLVNYMDANYRTIASAEGRALVGTSQGGYGAMKLGILHPDKFSVVASHTGLLYLDGVLSMGDLLVAENPDGFNGPDPTKFLTSALYAFSSALSPNLNNPPWMVDLPIDDTGNIKPDIRNLWLEHDVFTMITKPVYLANIKSLRGVYFDAGLQDELGMNQMADAFHGQLSDSGVTHTYENFDGGHFSQLFSRLEVSLKYCSDRLD
jgi:enterochelin esterase-like enzyme